MNDTPAHTQTYAAPPPARAKKGPVVASWLIIGVICVLAAIPAFGFLMWFVAAPVLFITLILGIVALAKGQTTQGIIILLTTLIVAPAFIILAPLVTTFVTLSANQQNTAHADSITTRMLHEQTANDRANADGASEAETAEPVPFPADQKLHAIGEVVDLGDSKWEVLESKDLGETLRGTGFSDGYQRTTGKFLYVKYRLTNVTYKEGMLMTIPAVRDPLNRAFEELGYTQKFLPERESSMTPQILPLGESKVFSSIFEVTPANSHFAFVARSIASDTAEALISLETPEAE